MSSSDHRPRAFGYVRASPAGDKSRDIRPQVAAIKTYYRGRLRKDYQWGGWIKDLISGGVPLEQRPGGLQLVTTLERGDCIVFAKVDRGFRDFVDLVQVCHKWDQTDVTAHFCDLGLDTRSELGRLVLYLLGIFAEWERKRIGGRIREALAVRKAGGVLAWSRAPYGKRCVGPKGKRRLVDDPVMRETTREIIRLKDECGLSFKQISERMIAAGWQQRCNHPLTVMMCWNNYHSEKKLQEEERRNQQP